MKRTQQGTSEGALVMILGMILGALLAFVVLEYGTRQQQKGVRMMTPPDPSHPTPKTIFNGNGFVKENVS